jgi:hypothetical protein
VGSFLHILLHFRKCECDYWVALLAHTFSCPYLVRKPKARVVTIIMQKFKSWWCNLMAWHSTTCWYQKYLQVSHLCVALMFCALLHTMLPCALHATPLEKGLGNDLPPIYLKPPKMIESFIIRTIMKTTFKLGIVCGRYQFLRFYVK